LDQDVVLYDQWDKPYAENPFGVAFPDDPESMAKMVHYGPQEISIQKTNQGFNLVARDRVLHKFRADPAKIIKYGDYIVFVEKEPLTTIKNVAEGTEAHIQNLYFIDLKEFQIALG